MRHRYPHSRLWRLATHALKYFLLGLAGCTVTYFTATALDLSMVTNLLVALIEAVFVQLAVLLTALLIIAIIFESLRY